MAIDSALSTVLDLVERFERSRSACGHAQAGWDEYASGTYNETHVRHELCLVAPLRVLDRWTMAHD